MTQQKFFEDRHYRTFGIIANLVFLAVWYLANDGPAFWDDFSYLNFAHQINEGTFEITNNHFTSRVALLYPVAWVIKYLGINEFTITIFPLICGLGVLNLLLWLGHLYHHWLGVLAATLFVCDYHVITFITHLFPEMPMMLFIFGALVAYDRANRKEGDHRLLALFTALGIFLAFLTKMTVILVGPLFIFLFIHDYWKRYTNRSYWMITVVLLVFFILANGFWYQELYGDFFYRFRNISDNHEATVKTFFDKDALTIIKRVTYLPLLGFARGGFFIPLLFALPTVLGLRKGGWKLNDPEKLWPLSMVFILLTWWFMSTNWKYYSPMPVDTRHITFLIPVMLMAGGMYWVKTPLLAAVRYSKTKYLLAFLLFIPVFKVSQSDSRNFKELDQVMHSLLLDKSESIRVFTDGLISYGYPYFYDFQPTDDQYIWFSEMEGAEPKEGDYLLVNPPYLNGRYNDFENLENFKDLVNSKGLKIEQVSRGSVLIYRIEEWGISH